METLYQGIAKLPKNMKKPDMLQVVILPFPLEVEPYVQTEIDGCAHVPAKKQILQSRSKKLKPRRSR